MERVLGFAYGDGWPARWWSRVPGSLDLAVTQVDLALLPAGSPPLRVGFVSDLHIGPTTPEPLLERAFDALARLAPDVLILGGDYVFLEATAERMRRLVALVSRVPAKLKLAVLGNHDLWTYHDRVEAALSEAGCRILINDALVLPAPHADVCVLGLDEPWTGNADAGAALRACPPGRVRLLVCHSPDGFLLQPKGVGLYLAGHTHGGHLALPGGKAVVLPPGPGSRRWPRGLHRYGDGYVFVSRGVGATEVPMRSFSQPEVALITLHDDPSSVSA